MSRSEKITDGATIWRPKNSNIPYNFKYWLMCLWWSFLGYQQDHILRSSCSSRSAALWTPDNWTVGVLSLLAASKDFLVPTPTWKFFSNFCAAYPLNRCNFLNQNTISFSQTKQWRVIRYDTYAQQICHFRCPKIAKQNKKVCRSTRNYKCFYKLGLSEYFVPKILNISSGFFKSHKIK